MFGADVKYIIHVIMIIITLHIYKNVRNKLYKTMQAPASSIEQLTASDLPVEATVYQHQ